mmetsp:Transcript_30287/g.68422  ORF Transcript_30287/g.68422 Transcript_30287/m.68422 type:complete len:208 (-) Transcript_30287:644-1267(-)
MTLGSQRASYSIEPQISYALGPHALSDRTLPSDPAPPRIPYALRTQPTFAELSRLSGCGAHRSSRHLRRGWSAASLLCLHVSKRAEECERDTDAVIQRDIYFEPHDSEDDVGDAPTTINEAMGHRVHLLEDKEVHLVVEIVENAVHEEELSWVAAVHHDRDQDRTLEIQDERQQDNDSVRVHVHEKVSVVHRLAQRRAEELGANRAG